MGNIKTSFVKNLGEKIYEANKEIVSKDFSKNKELVSDVIEIRSKVLRNKIAGYMTNLKANES